MRPFRRDTRFQKTARRQINGVAVCVFTLLLIGVLSLDASAGRKSSLKANGQVPERSTQVNKSKYSIKEKQKLAKPKIKRTFISFDEGPAKTQTSRASQPRSTTKTLKSPQLMMASGSTAATGMYLPEVDEMSVKRQREYKRRDKTDRVNRNGVSEQTDETSRSSLSTSIDTTADSRQRFKLFPALTYSVRSDLADERSPQISTHRLGAMMSATIFDRGVIPDFDEEMANELVTLTASISGQARMIGREVDGQQGGFDLADLDIAASRTFQLGDWVSASHSLEAALGTNVPTSVDSQYEGVKAVPYASVGVASSFRGGRIQVLNSVTGDYVVNTNKFSPSSRQINPDASAGYTLGGSILIASGVRLGASGTARLTHHLDGSVSNGFTNQQTLSWSNRTWTVALRHSNGTRPEDRESNLWFFDEVRRIVALNVTARF